MTDSIEESDASPDVLIQMSDEEVSASKKESSSPPTIEQESSSGRARSRRSGTSTAGVISSEAATPDPPRRSQRHTVKESSVNTGSLSDEEDVTGSRSRITTNDSSSSEQQLPRNVSKRARSTQGAPAEPLKVKRARVAKEKAEFRMVTRSRTSGRKKAWSSESEISSSSSPEDEDGGSSDSSFNSSSRVSKSDASSSVDEDQSSDWDSLFRIERIFACRWRQQDEMEYLVKFDGVGYRHLQWKTLKEMGLSKNDLRIISYHRRCTGGTQDVESPLSSTEQSTFKLFTQLDRVLSVRAVRKTSSDDKGPDFPPFDYPEVRKKQPPWLATAKTYSPSSFRKEYLVKWHLLGYADASWETEQSLRSSEERRAIDRFEKINATRDFPVCSVAQTQDMAADKKRESHVEKLLSPAVKSSEGSTRLWKVFLRRKLTAEGVYVPSLLNEESHTEFKGRTLMPHQQEGVKWLFFNTEVNRHGSLLADEMGLGKTCQSIVFLEHFLEILSAGNRVGCHALVVVQKSVIENWRREFKVWAPHLNVVALCGGRADREVAVEYETSWLDVNTGDRCNPSGTSKVIKPDVVLATYESLRTAEFVKLNSALFRGNVHLSARPKEGVKWACVVVDESQKMKGGRACLLLQHILQLKRDVTLLLTGTPIQNTTEELFPLLAALHPARFFYNEKGSSKEPRAENSWSVSQFNSTFTQIQDRKNCMQLTEQLHQLLLPYILRREKAQVLKSLPPKVVKLVKVPLTLTQKRIYSALYHKSIKMKGMRLGNMHMQLRKCCIHPYLIEGVEQLVLKGKIGSDTVEKTQKEGVEPSPTPQDHSPTKEDETESEKVRRLLLESSGKFVLLKKMLQAFRNAGRKVLVFSFFKIALDLVEDLISAFDYDWGVERVDGDTNGEERQLAIDRFNSDPDRFLFLCTTRAGGLGINLTAATAVIHLDSDFNPQHDLQAQSRCHRIGQDRTVDVFYFIAEHTYEDYIVFTIAGRKLGLEAVLLGRLDASKAKLDKQQEETVLRKGVFAAIRNDEAAKREAREFAEASIEDILDTKATTLLLGAETPLPSTQPVSIDSSPVEVLASPETEESVRTDKSQLFGTATFSLSAGGRQREDLEIKELDEDRPDFWVKVAERLGPWTLEDEELDDQVDLQQLEMLSPSQARELHRGDRRRKLRLHKMGLGFDGRPLTNTPKNTTATTGSYSDSDIDDLEDDDDDDAEFSPHGSAKSEESNSSSSEEEEKVEGALSKETAFRSSEKKTIKDPSGLVDRPAVPPRRRRAKTQASQRSISSVSNKIEVQSSPTLRNDDWLTNFQPLPMPLALLSAKQEGSSFGASSTVEGLPTKMPAAILSALKHLPLNRGPDTGVVAALFVLELLYRCLRCLRRWKATEYGEREGIRTEDIRAAEMASCKRQGTPEETEGAQSQLGDAWSETFKEWKAAGFDWEQERALLVDKYAKQVLQTKREALQSQWIEHVKAIGGPAVLAVLSAEDRSRQMNEFFVMQARRYALAFYAGTILGDLQCICDALAAKVLVGRHFSRAFTVKKQTWIGAEDFCIKLIFLHLLAAQKHSAALAATALGGLMRWPPPTLEVNWLLVTEVVKRFNRYTGGPERRRAAIHERFYNKLDSRWNHAEFTKVEKKICTLAVANGLAANVVAEELPGRSLERVKKAMRHPLVVKEGQSELLLIGAFPTDANAPPDQSNTTGSNPTDVIDTITQFRKICRAWNLAAKDQDPEVQLVSFTRRSVVTSSIHSRPTSGADQKTHPSPTRKAEAVEGPNKAVTTELTIIDGSDSAESVESAGAPLSRPQANQLKMLVASERGVSVSEKVNREQLSVLPAAKSLEVPSVNEGRGKFAEGPTSVDTQVGAGKSAALLVLIRSVLLRVGVHKDDFESLKPKLFTLTLQDQEALLRQLLAVEQKYNSHVEVAVSAADSDSISVEPLLDLLNPFRESCRATTSNQC